MNLTALLPHVPPAFMGFGFQEILLVGFVALLVFGGNLPDVMRQLGRTYARFRHSLNELSQPVRDEIRQVREVSPPDRSTTSYQEDVPDDGASPSVEGKPDDEAEEVPPTSPDQPTEDGIPRGGKPPKPDTDFEDEPPPV